MFLPVSLAILAFLTGATPADAEETVYVPLSRREAAIIPNTIMLSVGGGPSLPVLFDTGSAGLRILAGDLGPDVRHTSQAIRETYGDGTVLEGHLGYARVNFPEARGSLSTQEVAIHVVEHSTCDAGHPRCPGLYSFRGVMGVDDSPAGQLFNPLAQLPGALGSGFVVDVRDRQQPHLRVGLSARDLATFRFAPMPPGREAATGRRGWDTGGLTACYAIDSRPAGCQPVIFDTGGSAMHFSFGTPPAALLDGDHLVAGHSVTMRVSDLLELTEVTGPDTPVKISPKPRSNSGEAFFRRFAVAFDAERGRIGFLP